MSRHPIHGFFFFFHSTALNSSAANGGDGPCQRPQPASVAALVIVTLYVNSMETQNVLILFVVASSVPRTMLGTLHALNKCAMNG